MNAILVSAWTTVVMLVVFIGIVLWAWSSARRGDFDAASRLPLEDNDCVIGRKGCNECGRACSE
ncbi:MAG: cbb3-type cytochrome oxidase subunit 3 [Betaproteobacteria bacterium]